MSTDKGTWPLLALLIIALVIVLLVWARRFMARRHPGPTGAHTVGSPESNEPLRRRASAALVLLDDDVHSAEEDVTAARRDLGAAGTEHFRRTVTGIRAQVEDAYHVLHELEQDQKEGTTFPGVERARLKEILDLSTTAGEQLSTVGDGLDRLRELHTRIDGFLDELRGRADLISAQVPVAREVLTDLEESHSVDALRSLTEGLEQGTHLVAAARELIGSAESHEDDERPQAVSAARAAETALGQAELLISGTITGQEVLEEAAADLDEAMTSIREDISEADELSSPSVATEKALQEARAALESATSAREGGDVIAALTLLEHSEHRLDNALEPHREAALTAAAESRIAESRRIRRERMIARRFRHARRRIDGFARVVQTHRGELGETPRKNLQEARRLLRIAGEESDKDTVAGLLSQAEGLVEEVSREVIETFSQVDRESLDPAASAALLLALAIGGIVVFGPAALPLVAGTGKSGGGVGGGGRF